MSGLENYNINKLFGGNARSEAAGDIEAKTDLDKIIKETKDYRVKY